MSQLTEYIHSVDLRNKFLNAPFVGLAPRVLQKDKAVTALNIHAIHVDGFRVGDGGLFERGKDNFGRVIGHEIPQKHGTQCRATNDSIAATAIVIVVGSRRTSVLLIRVMVVVARTTVGRSRVLFFTSGHSSRATVSVTLTVLRAHAAVAICLSVCLRSCVCC